MNGKALSSISTWHIFYHAYVHKYSESSIECPHLLYTLMTNAYAHLLFDSINIKAHIL